MGGSRLRGCTIVWSDSQAQLRVASDGRAASDGYLACAQAFPAPLPSGASPSPSPRTPWGPSLAPGPQTLSVFSFSGLWAQ